MAPSKFQKANSWQCSTQMCSLISQSISEEPSVSLITTMDKHGQASIQIENKEVKTLFDSGASISCVNEHVLRKLIRNPIIEQSTVTTAKVVCGEKHATIGTVDLSFTIDGYPFFQTFHVFPRLHCSVILGRDFMQQEKMQIDFGTNSIKWLQHGKSQPIVLGALSIGHVCTAIARTQHSHVIPPHSEVILPLKMQKGKFHDGTTVICEPTNDLSNHTIAGGKCLSIVKDDKITYRLMNPTQAPVFLKKNSMISVVSEIDATSIVPLQAEDNSSPVNMDAEITDSHTINATTTEMDDEHYLSLAAELGINLDNSDLSPDQKRQLLLFIGKNRKVFAKDNS